MHKQDSLVKLQSLLSGANLYSLAETHHITVKKEGRLNKGWVGQTLEKIITLPNSNAQEKDGEDFELKSTTLVNRNGEWFPKETIKVTMLNPEHMLEETFETSALWNKLSSLILVGCHHPTPELCQVIKIKGVDVSDRELVQAVKTFWEDIQNLIVSGEFAKIHDIGRFDDWIQLRPTGDGKYFSTCPITGEKFPARSFYLTKKFISKILLE